LILVTGGCGFIGSNFVLDWLAHERTALVNLDKLTYAGNAENLAQAAGDPRYMFVHGDICDRPGLAALLGKYRPRAIVHFAAESHVDRSIHGPDDFVQTNIVGTFNLLEETRLYLGELPATARDTFRLVHVSTDEVYGSLAADAAPAGESAPYAPNSPYSASKAAADHLARAWHRTYGVPVITTNCSNNYGPYQFPEKLIPLMIMNALAGRSLPVYGDGMNVRDWLYVSDHCAAIRAVLAGGAPGEVYNIGGDNEMRNLDIVNTICALLDELKPDAAGSYGRLITFVKDRPGHDRRYAIDAGRIKRELRWRAAETFASGMRKTVQWYLDHQDWARRVQSGEYQQWISRNYGAR
jgi:dTDP-glucose 4,6-dehydratase